MSKCDLQHVSVAERNVINNAIAYTRAFTRALRKPGPSSLAALHRRLELLRGSVADMKAIEQRARR